MKAWVLKYRGTYWNKDRGHGSLEKATLYSSRAKAWVLQSNKSEKVYPGEKVVQVEFVIKEISQQENNMRDDCKCPVCGFVGTHDDFDVGGADDCKCYCNYCGNEMLLVDIDNPQTP